MKITYLGTGAAEGVPAAFCHCAVCEEVRRRGGKELRTRSQVLIDDTFCIDFPPDSYYHSIQYGVDLSAIETLLVTHSHMDHFYAHDFVLRGYKYATNLKSPTLSIFGSKEVKAVFDECTRREMREEVLETLPFTVLKPYEWVKVGNAEVLPLVANHSKAEECFVYLIKKDGKSILYLNDTGVLDDSVYPHLKGAKADLVSFDCTFVEEARGKEARHMGIGDNMTVKKKLIEVGAVRKDTKYVITHFSHNQAPLKETLEKLEREYGVIAAYDGMTINL